MSLRTFMSNLPVIRHILALRGALALADAIMDKRQDGNSPAQTATPSEAESKPAQVKDVA